MVFVFEQNHPKYLTHHNVTNAYGFKLKITSAKKFSSYTKSPETFLKMNIDLRNFIGDHSLQTPISPSEEYNVISA